MRFASFLLCLLLAATPAWAGVSTYASHRATYDMKLSRSANGSEVIDVRGSMTYEWQDACDGWTTSQESKMKFFYQDGRTVDLGWKLSSWESKDGLRYRFFVANTSDGKPAGEFKGDATLTGPGQGGSAHFTSPKAETITLPTGTLFPTGHTITLLNHLKDGDRLLFATVFDGTDDRGPFDISAVLADTPSPDPAQAALSPLLAQGPVYRVGLAFYSPGSDQSTPEHEQTLSVYANGIVSRISLNYGTFSVDGVLQKVEALPAPGC